MTWGTHRIARLRYEKLDVSQGRTTRGLVGTSVTSTHGGPAAGVSPVTAGTTARLVIDVVAKRERSGPVSEPAGIPGEDVEDLTDRQREVVETAYRAGYFDWPRDSTAEEVADSLDIAAPTFHAHLRKAESSLLDGLFDRLADSRGRPVEPESPEES